MTRIVIGLFDATTDADRAVAQLVRTLGVDAANVGGVSGPVPEINATR